MQTVDRFRGAMLGLAAGDALGATLEFSLPGTFTPIDDMIGGGPFGLKPGEWTDDTSLALCLAESLIECRGFDPVDQLQRYVRWWKEGYLSSTGECFGIGNTTLNGLLRFIETREPYWGSGPEMAATNGSLMRLAPVPLFYAQTPEEAIEMSGDSSRTTHGAMPSIDACRFMGGLMVGAVNGVTKGDLLSARYAPIPNYWHQRSLESVIDEVAAGSYKRLSPPLIKGTGYVAETLEAALWAFYNTSSFREGCLLAVNLGDDADTTGAVYGQLAGAFYGEEGIPESWLSRITQRRLIESYGEQLFALSGAIVKRDS